MANRLKNEQSPYLLQHADNPVNWRPWGDEAFAVAEKADKPIFLSIGYSTCRWCHVMARESFEDAEVARLMNETFICIKVDREERPDIDAVYMSACRLLTGSGGWPLTVFITADKKPFFAATYIPKRGRFGRVGLLDLIPRIGELWKSKRSELIADAEEIVEELRKQPHRGPEEKLDPDLLDEAYRELRTRYDERHGGFGDAPKFPMPHTLSFLLRYWNRTGSADALEMVEQTLQAMRRGGIYDHVGFGFHRYATDRAWILPHFEKMLYDQALLAVAYTEAFQLTRKVEYELTAGEILTYVLRNLKSEEGGFYCGEDAESEGKEGKFYLWTEQEIRRVLDPQSAALLIETYHIEPEGNFSEEAGGRKTGENILYRSEPQPQAPQNFPADERQLHEKLTNILGSLFRAREKRIRPHLDDKILTDWNGLMIAALAYAARVFENRAYLDAAQNAARFILHRLRDGEGRLLHRYRSGSAGIRAFLDDYAFLIWGLIEIYESGFDPAFLETALELNAQMVRNFRDDRAGGFYLTQAGAEETPVRKKDIYDGAVPAGNSVAMLNLLRLAALTGDPGPEETAAEISSAFLSEIARMPSAHCFFLIAADFALGPSFEIVVVGKKESPETIGMLQALQSRFIPNKVVLLKDTGREPGIAAQAEFVRPMSALGGKTTAYVCTGHACAKPVTSAAEMMNLLKER